MNIVVYSNQDLIEQSVDYKKLPLDYKSLLLVESDYRLFMDDGWNFNNFNSLNQLVIGLNNRPYAVGIYSDVLINRQYKNNMPYDPSVLSQENVISPIMLRSNVNMDFSSINNTQEIIRAVGLQKPLYRVPQILFRQLK